MKNILKKMTAIMAAAVTAASLTFPCHAAERPQFLFGVKVNPYTEAGNAYHQMYENGERKISGLHITNEEVFEMRRYITHRYNYGSEILPFNDMVMEVTGDGTVVAMQFPESIDIGLYESRRSAVLQWADEQAAIYSHDLPGIIAFCQMVVNNYEFDREYGDTNFAYNAIAERKSRCLGYSQMLCAVLDSMGVENYLIRGFAPKSPHAWTAFRLDGVMYVADLSRCVKYKTMEYIVQDETGTLNGNYIIEDVY